VEGSGPDTFGGSVVTLQSILLRTIIILRRGLRPVLFLDETLPAVDSNYTANIAVFLSDLCKKLGMDILVVTHNPTLFEMADNRYKIVRKNGESWFEKV
jgi:ABC-type lipoprotein export system ATPase subunit